MAEKKGWIITDGFYDIPILINAYREEFKEDKMPIHGLTNIQRPPRQGMIRLGVKKHTANGVEYPAEVDYFILDPETPDDDEKMRLIELFHSEFGAKPKSIAIVLPSSDINEVFPQNYKRYGKKTSLKCIGDGLTAQCTSKEFAEGLDIIQTLPNGLPVVTCKGRECMYATTNPDAKQKECKASATLSVWIPALGGLGLWQITTGSFYSIININGCIRSLIGIYGRAHSLPLTLERRPQETTYNGKKSIHYVLHMNTDKSIGEMVKHALIAPERVLIETYGESASKSLPAPDEIIDDDESGNLLPGPTVIEDIKQDEPEETAIIQDNQERTPEEIECESFGEEDEPVTKVADKPVNKPDKPVDPKKPSTVGSYKLPESVKKLTFWEFMPTAKKKLTAAGLGDRYMDALHTQDARVLSDLASDPKKMDLARVMVEAELEENEIAW